VQLPNAAEAGVAKPKITRYLLNGEHSDNGGKARFFRALGYELDRWWMLAEALRAHAQTHSVARTERSAYGTKYVIEGAFPPSNSQHRVRGVWMIDEEAHVPRFITAYPISPLEGR
jgi:hypothetical protein